MQIRPLLGVTGSRFQEIRRGLIQNRPPGAISTAFAHTLVTFDPSDLTAEWFYRNLASSFGAVPASGGFVVAWKMRFATALSNTTWTIFCTGVSGVVPWASRVEITNSGGVTTLRVYVQAPGPVDELDWSSDISSVFAINTDLTFQVSVDLSLTAADRARLRINGTIFTGTYAVNVGTGAIDWTLGAAGTKVLMGALPVTYGTYPTVPTVSVLVYLGYNGVGDVPVQLGFVAFDFAPNFSATDFYSAGDVTITPALCAVLLGNGQTAAQWNGTGNNLGTARSPADTNIYHNGTVT